MYIYTHRRMCIQYINYYIVKLSFFLEWTVWLYEINLCQKDYIYENKPKYQILEIKKKFRIYISQHQGYCPLRMSFTRHTITLQFKYRKKHENHKELTIQIWYRKVAWMKYYGIIDDKYLNFQTKQNIFLPYSQVLNITRKHYFEQWMAISNARTSPWKSMFLKSLLKVNNIIQTF